MDTFVEFVIQPATVEAYSPFVQDINTALTKTHSAQMDLAQIIQDVSMVFRGQPGARQYYLVTL